MKVQGMLCKEDSSKPASYLAGHMWFTGAARQQLACSLLGLPDC